MPRPPSSAVRAALVGISGYGRWHLLMVMEQAALGRIRLVAAAIVNQAEEPDICARLRRHGVKIFSAYDVMLSSCAGEIDLVMLPTSIHLHAPMTLAALRAGAHVLVEKPLAATLPEVDAIIAAEKAAKRRVFVGFQDLYVPLTHDLKRRLLAGEIGQLNRVVVTAQWPRSPAYFSRNAWAGRLRTEEGWVLDSPVNNAYAHFLMLALFWAGETAPSAAEPRSLQAELYRANEIESFDTACLRITTKTGITIELFCTHAGCQELTPEVRLIGSAGQIHWRYEDRATLEHPGVPTQTFRVPSQLFTRLQVLEQILDALEGRESYTAGALLARSHTRIVAALHEFFPIHSLPSDPARGQPNLDLAIAAGSQTGRLFAEQHLAWAIAAPRVDLAD